LQAQELRRYYSLQFITSSLEKKAAVARLKAKLTQDSPCIPIDDSVVSQDRDSLEEGKDKEHKPQI